MTKESEMKKVFSHCFCDEIELKLELKFYYCYDNRGARCGGESDMDHFE